MEMPVDEVGASSLPVSGAAEVKAEGEPQSDITDVEAEYDDVKKHVLTIEAKLNEHMVHFDQRFDDVYKHMSAFDAKLTQHMEATSSVEGDAPSLPVSGAAGVPSTSAPDEPM